FQAEDGIRDFHVTGVQTCALPIWIILSVVVFPEPVGPVTRMIPYGTAIPFLNRSKVLGSKPRSSRLTRNPDWSRIRITIFSPQRSEERRVGKEWSQQMESEH